VMMMGMRAFSIQPKLAKGAARRLTEYFLILSLGKSEFHHFNACSFPRPPRKAFSLLPKMIMAGRCFSFLAFPPLRYDVFRFQRLPKLL
jgi:hypothetical protein